MTVIIFVIEIKGLTNTGLDDGDFPWKIVPGWGPAAAVGQQSNLH
jgi:hypothetical protein